MVIAQRVIYKLKEAISHWPRGCRETACWCTAVAKAIIHTQHCIVCARLMTGGIHHPKDFHLRDADVSKSVYFSSSCLLCVIGDDIFVFSVVECPDPSVLEYGSVFPPQEKYFVDNETTYECYSGYTLRGSSRRVCLKNGKWSGSTPICSHDCK